jgi:hypothetical protein
VSSESLVGRLTSRIERDARSCGLPAGLFALRCCPAAVSFRGKRGTRDGFEAAGERPRSSQGTIIQRPLESLRAA